MTHRKNVMVLRIAKEFFLYISTVKREGDKVARISKEKKKKNAWVRSTNHGMPIGSRVLPIDLIRLA